MTRSRACPTARRPSPLLGRECVDCLNEPPTTPPSAGGFGRLDTAGPTATWHGLGTTIADETANAPDLTSTRDGELFGYFPETGGSSFVQQIDVKSGAPTGRKWNVPTRGSEAQAWAFAQWGGVFYVFATFDDKNNVYAVHRNTGKAEVVRTDTPYRVTGAGVSTCAPEVEQAN